MRKFTKICLIICLVLLGIGCICMGAGIAMGSSFREMAAMADEGKFDVGYWHMGRHGIYFGEDDEDDEEADILEGMLKKTYAADEIESLDADIKYGEVIFEENSSDQIEVSVDAPARNTYQCKIEDGTLKLQDKTKVKRIRNWGNDVTVTVSIPEGKAFDKVKIATKAGSVEISHHLVAEEISLDLDAGELTAASLQAEDKLAVDVGAGSAEVDDFTAENLMADCGVGEIELNGCVTKKAEADCGIGQITLNLKGSETDYNYDLDVGMGEIELNDQTYSSLSTSKKISHDADKDILLDCGIGQITVTLEE